MKYTFAAPRRTMHLHWLKSANWLKQAISSLETQLFQPMAKGASANAQQLRGFAFIASGLV
jgi:hypothetical protein